MQSRIRSSKKGFRETKRAALPREESSRERRGVPWRGSDPLRIFPQAHERGKPGAHPSSPLSEERRRRISARLRSVDCDHRQRITAVSRSGETDAREPKTAPETAPGKTGIDRQKRAALVAESPAFPKTLRGGAYDWRRRSRRADGKAKRAFGRAFVSLKDLRGRCRHGDRRGASSAQRRPRRAAERPLSRRGYYTPPTEARTGQGLATPADGSVCRAEASRMRNIAWHDRAKHNSERWITRLARR